MLFHFTDWARTFLKEMRHLTIKMNITIFIANKILIIFSLNHFFKKKNNIFRENCEKTFLQQMTLFERNGAHLTSKTNITFFCGKQNANYFFTKPFFWQNHILLENCQKTAVSETNDHFWGEWAIWWQKWI